MTIHMCGEDCVHLSDTERDLLVLLAQGLTSSQIGFKRSRNVQTIKNSLTYLYRKLGVQSRTEAVAHAFINGLLRIEGESLVSA